ncbi:SAM-dependent methyltransferase [Streptomyces ureilyticus]|uniref:Tetrapyrrole methylase domain-containing protein n=1 Tax=Streptomyces ureilyticus TaxID=1775131 RepID=A0ABX0DKL2_9ACTN|nr:SAM-dependent methyltransferase [Streptomyces ureilyticus]NGO41279.1 hypothetical protein [Streptomyces ureilyticus]
MGNAPGSLVVVGSGITAVAHITDESRQEIESADKVYYGLADDVTALWIRSLNPTAETLYTFYGDGTPRLESYARMVDLITSRVREGQRVCAVFYGHPGVFVNASHDAVRLLRTEGYEARMLPAVSAADCLFADLGIDPAATGCRMYEATDFLAAGRAADPTASLILWQVGVVGAPGFSLSGTGHPWLPDLVSRLEQTYGPDFEVVVYEAAQFTVSAPRVDRVPLRELCDTPLSGISTLYVPPAENPQVGVGTDSIAAGVDS